MSIECHVCGYENNPPDAEFCETCGAELTNRSTPVADSNVASTPPAPLTPPPPQTPTPPASPTPPPSPTITPPSTITPPAAAPPNIPPSPTPTPQPTPVQPPVSAPPAPSSPPIPTVPTGTTARLIARLANAPIPEFSINGGALVGIFTPESGPVDIDLEAFPGNETISKQHAEIMYENGAWILKDSSTNGTYIKPVGQTRFGARVMGPTEINSGDEIAFAKVVFVFQTP